MFQADGVSPVSGWVQGPEAAHEQLNLLVCQYVCVCSEAVHSSSTLKSSRTQRITAAPQRRSTSPRRADQQENQQPPVWGKNRTDPVQGSDRFSVWIFTCEVAEFIFQVLMCSIEAEHMWPKQEVVLDWRGLVKVCVGSILWMFWSIYILSRNSGQKYSDNILSHKEKPHQSLNSIQQNLKRNKTLLHEGFKSRITPDQQVDQCLLASKHSVQIQCSSSVLVIF